jgi:hypothetical protein
VTDTGLTSATEAVAGALTAGGRSVLPTWITVLAEPDRALAAVKLTV